MPDFVSRFLAKRLFNFLTKNEKFYKKQLKFKILCDTMYGETIGGSVFCPLKNNGGSL